MALLAIKCERTRALYIFALNHNNRCIVLLKVSNDKWIMLHCLYLNVFANLGKFLLLIVEMLIHYFHAKENCRFISCCVGHMTLKCINIFAFVAYCWYAASHFNIIIKGPPPRGTCSKHSPERRPGGIRGAQTPSGGNSFQLLVSGDLIPSVMTQCKPPQNTPKALA